MRKFFRNTIGAIFTLSVIACIAVFYLLLHAPAFENGENYTFYLGANSSALAKASPNPVLEKYAYSVKGESVQYSGNRLEELTQRYRAKLLFTEEACGVTNYYFYSPLLKNSVELGGYAVNLHIAVSAEKTVAGTPIIFGGF